MVNSIITTSALKHEVQSGQETLTILKGIDLTIEAGTSVAIIGASGSGKSTLLGMLAGLDTPSHGSIHLAGEDITKLDEEGRARVRAEKVGFVFQNFQLLSSLTALENVMLPLEVKKSTSAANDAKSLLERVGLGARMDHYPVQLSGGEQQRVAVARAFASNAPILFADEPTGNLDRKTGEKVADLLFELNAERQTTLILVTHDPKLAERCQRQLEMIDGVLHEVKA
ncbi:ABC transporter ATP-binding protein [Salinibius halmophilus]|uniref:ABC transporter ATP-binding protein n=1 Tax=Salinibius halmophilus TaxID=1853216 RepID=UPI000E6724B0|nr:ABC transporter ATP-binding protein [Salinibius halmophilus]